jgi:hypothetical protein
MLDLPSVRSYGHQTLLDSAQAFQLPLGLSDLLLLTLLGHNAIKDRQSISKGAVLMPFLPETHAVLHIFKLPGDPCPESTSVRGSDESKT